ncbi:MAG: serine/threonine protein kinase [Proteobacteria bacterium]|nr:serine/threonine protein kinase [Pseudomonadota bacterium]
MKTVLTAADWSLLQELFDAAVDLPSASRSQYLDERCAHRPELRAKVESLLRSATDDDFLGAAVREAAEDASEGALPAPGDYIGPYQIVRILGRGGMGIVYEATRADDQYQKKVAIKLVAAGLLTRDLLPRFRAERQILANLDHPNVARLLDGGATQAGLPYVVLEFIDGKPLDRYCRDHAVDLRRKLRLVAEIARAVQYAHQNLIVHRDLKPANILVTADGIPKLLDFGIAKLLDLDAEAAQPRTLETTRMMTPEYASPEQISGKPVSTSADIYQLGIILYELLAGERPFRAADLQPGELERAILVQPVPRLKVDADVDRILQKATAKEPARRYGSANEFADDLERFLNGFPVLARPASWTYRARKFASRHRAGVAAAALFVTLIAGFGIAMAFLAQRARNEAATAQEVSQFLVGLFEDSNPDAGGPDQVTARSLIDKGAQRAETQLKDHPLVQARLYDAIGQIYISLGMFRPARDILVKADQLQRTRELPDDMRSKTLSNLGSLSYELGDFAGCEKFYREAIKFDLASGGSNNPRLVNDYNGLVASLTAQNRLAEAESLGRQSVELSMRVHGRVHGVTARAINNLKSALLLRGDYVTAEKMAREAFEIRRELSPEGRDLAMYQGNLAYLLSLLGRFQEAETEARESQDRVLRSTGDGTPAAAFRRLVLSNCLLGVGKFAEALDLAKQGYEMQVRLLGPTHSDTLVGAETYSLALLASGEAIKAHSLCQSALATRLQRPGSRDRLDTAVAWMRCGKVAVASDVKAAADAFGNALRVRRAGPSSNRVLVAESQSALGDVLVRQGDFAKAEPLLRDALAALEQAFPPGHPQTAQTRASLAALYLERNAPERALPLMEQAYEALRAAHGPKHPETARAAIRLAACLQAAQKRSTLDRRAQQLRDEYAEILKSAGPSTRAEQQLLAKLAAAR